MSDFLKIYEESIGGNETPQENSNPYPSTQEQIASQENSQEGVNTEDIGGMPQRIPGSPEEEKARENTFMANQMLGAQAGRNKDIEADPDSWGPGYTTRGFIEESGTSIVRGIGKHIVKGTGDMLQAAGAIAGLDPRGNFITNLLQEKGEEISQEWRSFIPEELQHENLDFNSLANPKFWSIHAAEMIPQILEFILISKGGSGFAKQGVKKVAQKLSRKTALGAVKESTKGAAKHSTEVFGSGSGLIGKIATDQGLTQLGGNVVGAVGGGVTGNIFSGILNASQVINENKDLGIFSDEELSSMAASTVRNNMAWMALDIASWGFTYGNLGKSFKGLNPLKGIAKSAKTTKVGKELFKYDIAPIIKGIGRVSKKAGMEGLEETFQESFEEWAAKKAQADQTGFFSEDLFDAPSFMDFYKSKENRGTLVLSAAMGALGGAAFNIDKLVNDRADEAYRMQNRIENFENIKNKKGTKEELDWQQYHIHQQIADIVNDDKIHLYEDFSNKLVANENITKEEKNDLDKMVKEFIDLKAKGKRLNVRGINALLHHKSNEIFYKGKMDSMVEESREKINEYRSYKEARPSDIQKKIAEEEESFKMRFNALSIKHAKSIQNQQNLILGKRAEVDNVEITLDKFGNEMIVDGLTESQINKYTKEGDERSGFEKAKSKFNIPSLKGLTRGARETVKKLQETYNIFKEPTEVYDENGELIKEEKPEVEKEQEASGETFVNGEKVQTPKTEQQANEEAEEMAEEATVSENEVIDQDVWDSFKENSSVTQGVIDDIAQSIYTNDSLSERQEEIRGKNRERVKEAIAKRILKTTDNSEGTRGTVLASEEISEEAKKKQEKERIVKIRDRFRDALGNLKRKNFESNAKWKKRVEENIKKWEAEFGKPFTTEEIKKIGDGTLEAEFEVIEDDMMDDTESEFVEAEVMEGATGKSVKKDFNSKAYKTKKNYKANPERMKNAEDAITMDKRNDDAKILIQNIEDHNKIEDLFRKLRRRKLNSNVHVSQNELDNYLNRVSTFNEFGPSEVHKMQVVNHALKNMFPNMKYPTQVYIVDNLYHSLGSVGLGAVIGSSIFIDEKAWDQDEVFMHELSHIYYRLSKDEPETKRIIKNILLKDKDLVNEIKNRYDDYTLYEVKDKYGNYNPHKKSKIMNQLNKVPDTNPQSREDILRQMIEKGDVRVIPLEKQELLIEEMFAKKLEGPMAKNFDKVFMPKNEPQRQEEVKLWWGFIRKRGKVLEENGNIDRMIDKVFEDSVSEGSLKDHVFSIFKATTEGTSMNYEAMERRADNYTEDILKEHSEIGARLNGERATSNPLYTNPQEGDVGAIVEQYQDEYEQGLETDGQAFYNKDHNSKIKGASKILRDFGALYNKVLRKRYLKESEGKPVNFKKMPSFDRDLFESTIFGLATENNNVKEFIRQIENSEIEEVQAFNRYIKKAYPNSNLQMLAGMHFVFSNSKHITGIRNTMKGDRHWMQDSLSIKEQNRVDHVLSYMTKNFSKKGGRMEKFNASVKALYNGSTDTEHIINILDVVSPYGTRIDKIIEQGYVTFQGVNIDIDTLIAGYAKKGLFFRRDKNTDERIPNNILVGEARPLIEAIVNTNRKFTPNSMVQNAEGNYEPVRITNNHLTKELDDMIDFLHGDENGNKPTIDQFLNRFSHMNEKSKKENGRSYVANQFLENVYFDFQRGITPQISQYHGLMDIESNKGNVYKKSTALEQGIEDFMIYATSSRGKKGKKNRQFLANLGTFSDSPRKFFMNMHRIDYNDIFEVVNGKGQFKKNGETINSIYHVYKNVFPHSVELQKDPNTGEDFAVESNKASKSKTEFKRYLKEAIRAEVEFMQDNAEEISSMPQMKPYFDNKKLNNNGAKLIAEYVVNSIAAGVNVSDTFLPNITDQGVVKRMKANSSPIFSAKNENFRIEPLFFSDELINGKESGTDSGMYILKEDAEKLQNLGRGIFDMNNGFKILNSSIEKDNPKFAGKMAYLKGYTTVIDKGHPLYDALKSRKDKYNEYHLKKYGTKPSMDLNDGSFNHLAIAVPVSSDKSGFAPHKFIKDGKYTPKGLRMSPAHIRNNLKELNADQDALYYDANGDFLGINSYNFGPQQVMDKITKSSNTPVQMENSIIVNAAMSGNLDLAISIQEHISNQKREFLQAELNKIKDQSPEQYKAFIMESLNLQDMDQAQRVLLEDGGSLSHPAVNQIVVNQLAKTLRRMGNKLKTPGTNAHQKPDIGYEAAGGRIGQRLKGYEKNTNGTLKPAEIVLPNHMANGSKSLERMNFPYHKFTKIIPQELQKDKQTFLAAIRKEAMKEAAKRAGKYDNTEPKDLVTPLIQNGTQIGWQVRGDLVIASRVPGHGPSSTGVFEVVGYDNSTDGNQVMVPSEFNEIIGADNDGDSLFIQTVGHKQDYAEWNKAFDKFTNYWLSKDMAEQIQTTMDFEKETEKMIQKEFPQGKDKELQFSPSARRTDYNNTMVSQRNISPVFSTHKVTNMLAAYNIEFDKPIKVNGKTFKKFEDSGVGANSRNQKSAILANIILDNAKWGFADALGLDEHNISQAVLLVNMGFSLRDVGKILNSKAAKEWSNVNRKRSSLFHEKMSKRQVIDKVYSNLKLGEKRPSKKSFNVNTETNIDSKQNQIEILEMLSYLSDMNSEVQKVSAIMSGHNKIHVNPLVLEKQLKEFQDLVEGNNEDKILDLTENFKDNPNLKNYVHVAKETLKHTQVLNPVYRKSTNKVLRRIEESFGRELSPKQIEELAKGLEKFNTSRLLGLNNTDVDYVKNLMSKDLKNPQSIYVKLKDYVSRLRQENLGQNGPNVVKDKIKGTDNSLLFGRALNVNLSGNNPYISINPEFVNESFTKEERERAQREFEDLPLEIQDDLMLYDLIERGWSGKTSLAPIFGREANFFINMAANEDFKNKNEEIPEKVLEQLERIVVLKESMKPVNSLIKVRPGKGEYSVEAIMKNNDIRKHLIKTGKPVYALVKRGWKSHLYKMDAFTSFEEELINSEPNSEGKNQVILELAKKKFRPVKNDLYGNGDLDIAMIKDNNEFKFKNHGNSNNSVALEPIVAATISYEEAKKKLLENLENSGPEANMMEAREDFDMEMFTKDAPLTQTEFEQAMEYEPTVSPGTRASAYEAYLKAKKKSNSERSEALKGIESKSMEDLVDMYQRYGNENVYAYSNILTPVLTELAKRMADDQASLWNKNNVEGKGFDGKDIGMMQAYLIGGSTIPSNHPTSQAMARILETEYKKFIGEKTKRISEMNAITERLYKRKLGYGTSGFVNKLRAIRDAFFVSREEVYQRLYGNLVKREEKRDPETGKITYDFKLRKPEEIQADFRDGKISKEEKDFFEFFKKTTNELMPDKIKKDKKEDYIPHTAMNKFEAFGSRGLLGLMLNSRTESEALYDVKIYHDNLKGERKLMTFKNVEDIFKGSAAGRGKNSIAKMKEYRDAKRKAIKLLKKGKNEDGSPVKSQGNMVETALGFGAMNRFTNNRSISAKEMPSMDLNKALGDYIHSTIFVNGAGDFKGMEKLQGYIDAALAFNRKEQLPNMNAHVQKVWKDYFLRGKRQESFAGKKVDNVVRSLTRLNLFYALGYQANKNTGGLYALGNVLVGKYHNIKDVGGKEWLRGEAKFWGLDKGFKGGFDGVIGRHKRMMRIMKNLNFMDINIYDEVNIEKSNGVDAIFSKIALGPMIVSESWIQKVHMIGLLTDEELNRFDEEGNYKSGAQEIGADRLVELEDQVKLSHGRGYQPTDQRAIQMYSWGNMMLQFSRFIPTMIQDRFSKKDVNSYGKETIGSLRQVSDMVRYVVNNPMDFSRYYKSLNDYEKKRLESGLKGMAMSAVIGMVGGKVMDDLYGDANYYFNHSKLENKMIPPAVQSTRNLVSQLF